MRENTEDLYEGIEFDVGSKEVNKLRGYLKYMYGFEICRDAGVSVKPISITATTADRRSTRSNTQSDIGGGESPSATRRTS